MRNTLKVYVAKAFKLFGLEVSRLPTPLPSPTVHHGIDVVFDVGANIGQYALLTRKEGFRGRIISFEPLPEAHLQLAATAKTDVHWTVHPRCALGSSFSTKLLNISKNSYSSSILPILDACRSAAPNSIYIGEVETPLITLDSVFDNYCAPSEKVFLKIDTQGYEWEVLVGASEKLSRIKVVQLELSTVQLYGGQKIYKHFFDFFESKGFYLWSILPGFANRETGQHLQFDAVFVNGLA